MTDENMWQRFGVSRYRVETVWPLWRVVAPRWLCALFRHPMVDFAPERGVWVGFVRQCPCSERSVWW